MMWHLGFMLAWLVIGVLVIITKITFPISLFMVIGILAMSAVGVFIHYRYYSHFASIRKQDTRRQDDQRVVEDQIALNR